MTAAAADAATPSDEEPVVGRVGRAVDGAERTALPRYEPNISIGIGAAAP